MALAASDKGLILTTLPGREKQGVTGPVRPAAGLEPPEGVRSILDSAEVALVDYYAFWPGHPGERIAALWAGILALPIDLDGLTAFTRKVLGLLRQVPPGGAVSYGVLAARAGSPRAARAVGTVMARNPLPIVVPCHRVVTAAGGLGGFSGGTRQEALALKQALLRYEGWTAHERGITKPIS